MKLLLRNSFEVSTKEIIFRMRNIFVGNSSTLRKKKQKRKQKKSSEIKSGLDLGSTDLDTKKSPGNAGPTLANLSIICIFAKVRIRSPFPKRSV